MPIYLDHAAATPMDKRVLAAMQPYLLQQFYNPSATYLAAIEVHKALSNSRGSVAHWLGTHPAEIIFTAGGTEANNLAIHGIMRRFPKGNVLISAIEHESVMAPAAEHKPRVVKVTKDGRLDLNDLKQKIDEHTILVSVMQANNEIGTIQPLREVAKVINEERAHRLKSKSKVPIYFHSDGCQGANYLDLHVARAGVDLLTLNGGKIYGPKQSGALYVKGGVALLPLIDGGGQERGLRSGTENVAGDIGFSAALDLVQNDRQTEAKRLQRLQQLFIAELAKQLPAATINGSLKYRLPNNIHLSLPGRDNERLLIQLDQAGIQAAAGSACSASKETASHVLSALGLSETAARSSIRLTMGRDTTEVEVRKTVSALARLNRL